VWTDSWLSIVGAGCDLICVGAGEELARKVYVLRGLRGVERQVSSARWSGGQRGQVRAAWWQEKQDEVVDRSRCRVEAHDRSLKEGLWQFTTKTSGYLVEPQTKTGGSASEDEIRAR
jgi:hypothetical protein